MISSAFRNDPLGYVGNQSGHAGIGAGLGLLGLSMWPMCGASVAVFVAFSYFVAVEWWWQRLLLFWDSVEDACHVAFGVGGVVVLDYYGPPYALALFGAWGVVLAIGYWRRT